LKAGCPCLGIFTRTLCVSIRLEPPSTSAALPCDTNLGRHAAVFGPCCWSGVLPRYLSPSKVACPGILDFGAGAGPWPHRNNWKAIPRWAKALLSPGQAEGRLGPRLALVLVAVPSRGLLPPNWARSLSIVKPATRLATRPGLPDHGFVLVMLAGLLGFQRPLPGSLLSQPSLPLALFV